MKTFTTKDWEVRKDRYWNQFFNTLSGLRSPVLIGTSDEHNQLNLAIFNSLVHIGANPPLMGFILRPTTVARHTYENILHKGLYSINHIPVNLIDKAHQTSAKYPVNISEFDAVELNYELDENGIPTVTSSSITFHLRFQEQHLLSNETRLIVGEIQKVTIDPNIIEEDGSIKLAEENLVVTSGLYHYHTVVFVKKKNFARP